MGIDIYASWRGQSETEQAAQITGFSAEHGHVGYLREAYHGEPYATRVLLPEAFAAKGEPVAIPAALLNSPLTKSHSADCVRPRRCGGGHGAGATGRAADGSGGRLG